MVLTEDQLKYRDDIIETLQLISSRDEQLEYQRQVPMAHVSAEIFCHWGDCCYRNGKHLEEEWCRPIFSPLEREAMANFNDVLNQISGALPEPPWIEQFVLMPEWARLSEAAATALSAFNQNDT